MDGLHNSLVRRVLDHHSGVLFTRVERLLVGQLDWLMSLVDGGSARPGMCTRYQTSNQSYPSGVSMILLVDKIYDVPDCMYHSHTRTLQT